jgi:hypothetical protein
MFRDRTVAAISYSEPMVADAMSVYSDMVMLCLEHSGQTPRARGFDAMRAPLSSKEKP